MNLRKILSGTITAAMLFQTLPASAQIATNDQAIVNRAQATYKSIEKMEKIPGLTQAETKDFLSYGKELLDLSNTRISLESMTPESRSKLRSDTIFFLNLYSKVLLGIQQNIDGLAYQNEYWNKYGPDEVMVPGDLTIFLSLIDFAAAAGTLGLAKEGFFGKNLKERNSMRIGSLVFLGGTIGIGYLVRASYHGDLSAEERYKQREQDHDEVVKNLHINSGLKESIALLRAQVNVVVQTLDISSPEDK